MQFSQWQRRQQAKRVEMTAVICHDHERPIGAEIFVTDNFEAVINPQQSANDQCSERAQSIDEHVGFARELAEPLERRSLDIIRRIVTPPFHRSG